MVIQNLNAVYIISDKSLKALENKALSELDIRRLLHSLSTGQVLYRLYPQCGKKNARFIALFHDIAHHWTSFELRSYIKDHNIHLEDGEDERDILLHAPIAADLLRRMVPDCPDEWVNAIRRHTIPHKDMSELSYALFVADIIEPTRPFIRDEEREKVYAMKSNDERMLYSMREQGKYLRSQGSDHLKCTEELMDILSKKCQI